MDFEDTETVKGLLADILAELRLKSLSLHKMSPDLVEEYRQMERERVRKQHGV